MVEEKPHTQEQVRQFLVDALKGRYDDNAMAAAKLIVSAINQGIDIQKWWGIKKVRGPTHQLDLDKAGAIMERHINGELAKKDAINEINKLIPTAARKTAANKFKELAPGAAYAWALRQYLEKLVDEGRATRSPPRQSEK